MQGGGRSRGREMSLFADPFAGRSLLSNFFDEDPFFSDFFDSRSFFFGDPFSKPSHRRISETSRKGPVIEEIDDDEERGERKSSEHHQQPIVEHPDDEDGPYQSKERNSYQRNTVATKSNQRPSRDTPFQTFTFQSSSFSYGGSNGRCYTTSTSRRMGPDGVIEEEHREADSATGQATQRRSRGIYDKGHSLTKKRNFDGRVETLETLHNLEADELQRFDQEWQKKASKYLPGWNEKSGFTLEGQATQPTEKRSAMRALPSTSNHKGEKEKNPSGRKWFGLRRG